MGLGTGIQIDFGTSGFNARIHGIVRWGGEERPVIDDADHSIISGARPQLIGKVYMPPAIEVEMVFDSQILPPIDGDPEVITITYPDGATHQGTGAIVARGWEIPYEQRGQGTYRIQFVDAPQYTPPPP